MLILSSENEFNLRVNEISFSYESMSTKTRFEEEAKSNSEMAYSLSVPIQTRWSDVHDLLPGSFYSVNR